MFRTRLTLLVWTAALLAVVRPAGAVVVQLSAEVTSQVQSFIAGELDSLDQTTEVFGPDSGLALPISAHSELMTPGLALGVSAAVFEDPTQETPTRNPEEMTLEAGSVSNDDVTRYDILSSVVEERVIRLSADELGNPVGGSRPVQSAFFPSGALLIWSSDATRDLTGVSAEVQFEVRRIGLGPGGERQGPVVLLSRRAALVGGANGAISSEVSTGLFAVSGDLSILDGVVGLPFGSLDVFATNRITIIPENQQLDYTYDATVDVDFILEAAITLQVSNLPVGTGAVASFGQLNEAVNVIQVAAPEDTAKAVQDRMNKAIQEFRQPAVQGGVAPIPCGLLGFEMMGLAAMTLTLFAIPRGRSLQPMRTRRTSGSRE